MASAELKELLELAKEAGLEGTELSNFLRDERTRQREREKEEREREKEEREHHREREKAESDALQREADRRHEIELARLRVEDNVLNRSGQAERNIGSMGSVPKLPSFDEKMDDLDAYLYRFEGYATMQGWPKERWASNLSALLKGNALQVFHRMSLDDSGDYELLKIALLNRYRLTDADFRNKFRQAKPQDGESFSQFGIPITGYLDRWIELSETSLSYEGIRDLLIREQTLGVGSAELRVFIEERTPGSFKEMCNIAEQYLKAHGKSFRHWWMSDKHRSEGHETKGLNSENKNRFSNATSKFHGRSGQARVNGQSNPTAGRACWICSSVKHYARECPQNKPDRPMQSSKSKVGGNATVLACEEALLFKGGLKLTTKQDGDLRYFEDKGGKKYQVEEIVALASEQNKGMITALGRVSGRPDTIEVLRDSGCSTMVIREDLCDPRDFTGETRGCVMMDGRVIEVPVVKKKVDTPYYIGEVEGVVMKAPIYDLVIGNVHGARGQEDPDTSWEIPTGEEITEHEMSVESQDVGPAITSHEKTGGVVTRLQSKNKPLRPMKVAKTKIVNLTSTEFKKLQSYEGIRDLLIREQTLGVGSAELRVFIEERTPGSFKEMCNIAEQYLKAHGKSFRHWWMSDKHRSEGHETKGLNSENKNRFSNATSKFHGRSGQARVNGQSNPTAGRACWICSSVKHYARECPQNKPDRPMQSSKSKVGGNATVLACEEALLFKGGLKLTTKQDGDLRYFEDKGGKKYQVEEIVALASEQNKGMITALGRVSGRPDTIEVLRDSGCSTMVIREDLCDPRDFTGETRGCVMMDGRVIEVPVVKKKVDTPYYIGEVEGVVMKAPIYDLVIGNVHGARGQEDPDTSWEIPTGEEITEHEMSVESQDVGPAITSHEKTGGVVTRLQSKNKPLRPMKVAKTKIVNLTSTEFKKLQETDKSLDKLRKKIESDSVESTCKLAHDKLRKAQGNQHKWFNKKAKAKHLKEGDQVLLLLPTKLNKLEMQWQGPFDIIKKVRENDYVINLDGQHKMFHANMLRKYLVRKTIDNGMVILCGCRHLEIATGEMAENDSLEETDTCEERSDDIKYCPLRATQTWKDVKISTDLNEDQQREVRQLLEEYSDVLTDIPGKTNLAECNIELTDDIPFRVKAYPVPYALKKEMDKEVSEMMKADIIESSVSEYASSPVVVRKPDGSVRYCIDFRKLNAKTV